MNQSQINLTELSDSLIELQVITLLYLISFCLLNGMNFAHDIF